MAENPDETYQIPADVMRRVKDDIEISEQLTLDGLSAAVIGPTDQHQPGSKSDDIPQESRDIAARGAREEVQMQLRRGARLRQKYYRYNNL